MIRCRTSSRLYGAYKSTFHRSRSCNGSSTSSSEVNATPFERRLEGTLHRRLLENVQRETACPGLLHWHQGNGKMGDVTAITSSLVILCTGKDRSKTRRSKNTDTATLKDRFFACQRTVGAILVIARYQGDDHKDRPYGCCLSMAPWPPDCSGAGSGRVGVSA